MDGVALVELDEEVFKSFEVGEGRERFGRDGFFGLVGLAGKDGKVFMEDEYFGVGTEFEVVVLAEAVLGVE